MVERSYSLKLPGGEVTDLRIALYEHKEHLQKLQEELDAEREASAISASEALSMILKLQGEKAALTMEARQYKRMVEEEMTHAEMLLALLEDLIYQKELEITGLEYQVQAYRSKLLSLGCSNLADVDMKLEENSDDIMLKMNDKMLFGEKGESSERRIDVRCDRSQTPSPEPFFDVSVPVEKGVIEQSLDSRIYPENSLSPRGDLDSYWEKIEKLEEKVKEITEFRDSLRDKYTNLKQDSLSKQEKGVACEDLAVVERESKRESKGAVCEDSPSLLNVPDIFEVPRAKEKAKGVSKSDLAVKLKDTRLVRKSSKQPKDGSIKRSRARASSSANNADYQAELQWLKERIERLEGERSSTRNESSEIKQEEEMSLLKQIKEQLNSVQSEMKSLRTNQKSPPRDDTALLSVQEAMLYFWL